MSEKSTHYPDSGAGFEDASVLRNAVFFSTAQRAYCAELLLSQPMHVNQQTLDFLIVRAFEEFMTSTEDMIGWLFALKEWQPGTPEHSLFLLLDRIQVGRDPYDEAKAVSLLESTDAEGFRKFVHIPTDAELVASGMETAEVGRIGRSMSFKLDGWRNMAKKRAEEDRGMVVMFNKLKHHMRAFISEERGRHEVLIPYSISMHEKERQIRLSRGWLVPNLGEVRRLAGDAVAAQAVLHDTLALLLKTRYGGDYSIPPWVMRAYQNYVRG